MTNRERTVVLTGGGTAGHVTPNLALLPALRAAGFHIEYVGAKAGIERELVTAEGLPYHSVETGKLRRYASWQNWIDPLRVVQGVGQAYRILNRVRPDVVFSKGGYVAVPVVLGAWLHRIPVVVHESDRSPGLANRIAFPFCARICTSFEESAARLRASMPARARRIVCTGSPVRRALLAGDRARAERRFGLDPSRSLVLVFGGSLGARAINAVVGEFARALPSDLQLIHVCGKGNLDPQLANLAHYHAFEYLQQDFADALARADAVVSRAGANSLSELLALRKPAVLIPLPSDRSRGDQIENAQYYTERGYGLLLPQAELNRERLEESIRSLLNGAALFRQRMETDTPGDAAAAIVAQLDQVTGSSVQPHPPAPR
jgi:UDP-N-acetylglucosamine--N-acetylmuramyl-(pentapeptide) pyrophosphoryl-undecaprenol N-acetylglucosamine transferase